MGGTVGEEHFGSDRQTAYEWTDSPLHRFSIGGDTFDMAAEWFLCEYDAEEDEDEGACASTRAGSS